MISYYTTRPVGEDVTIRLRSGTSHANFDAKVRHLSLITPLVEIDGGGLGKTHQYYSQKGTIEMTAILLALMLSLGSLGLERSLLASKTLPHNEITESSSIPFADFDAQIEVEKTEFEVRGGFTLAPNSNGINLFKEEVSFEVGPLVRTIPAGAFKEEKRGKISYSEASKDVILDVTIKIVGNNQFTVKIEGVSETVTKDVRPEQIKLKIGDDEGRARPRVKVEKEN